MEFSYNQVKSLLDIVQPFLIRAGVKNCHMPTGETNLIKPQKYIDAYNWLDEILKSEEWSEVERIWNLLPPDVWEGYDMFGFEGLAEQILLENACTDLKNLWKTNRPSGFFGKHIDESENYEETDSN